MIMRSLRVLWGGEMRKADRARRCEFKEWSKANLGSNPADHQQDLLEALLDNPALRLICFPARSHGRHLADQMLRARLADMEEMGLITVAEGRGWIGWTPLSWRADSCADAAELPRELCVGWDFGTSGEVVVDSERMAEIVQEMMKDLR